MNRFSRKLLVSTTLLSLCSVATMAYARGEGGAAAAAGAAGVRAGLSAVAAKAQTTGVGANDAANASLADQAAVPAAAVQPAVNPCKVPTLLDGWYIGAQAGYGSYRVRNNINFFDGAPLYAMDVVNAGSNWSVGGVIGYGKMLSQLFYLGGELSIVANTMEHTLYSNFGIVYTNQYSSGPTYGLSLLPGIRLTNETLTYLRFGYNRVKFNSTETIVPLTPVNVSKNLNGFVIGIGMETLITGNYSVRGEFDHVFFSSYNTAGYYNTAVSPAYNGYALTFIYHA